ncbi:MAG: phosphoglycerate dehydrogenase [Gammaproteobacteria bacterium]|jgi:D-3-phosphoglycerate dehydrogenase|nr:phosphoglycerate dehydrogenase [Gammaproteobacteria bacterium]NCW08147.1 phosphoglycerate dehydrogenase [Gammaproteobacteria bacterium]NCW73131.1 phosphoglycerate dehydrogenase [Gammaproteobacteria bacterium]NCX47945.1 phosphoglycerate dehydrogenase [Gammaproteobacteria bacterium]
MTTSFDKSKLKVLLLEGIHPSAERIFRDAGYENIETVKTALTGDELKAKLEGVHFLGIRSRTTLTRDIFEAADKLVAVGCYCIGTNQVDLTAATEHGVVVFNAPYSNTRSVAELVLAEAILLLRGIPEKSAQAHRGGWAKTANDSFEIRGKTLGIVGYGSIGSQLSVLAESLGMRVIFYDVVSKLPLGNASQIPSLEGLLGQADIVTLHVPDLPSTRNLMDQERISQMKPKSILINASRGTVVDIDALTKALEEKHLLGTAIDVFPVEPKSNNDEFISPLRGFDNAILTPHIGGSTQEAQENIGVEVAEKLVRYSDNGSTLTSVNFPEVALPPHPNHHRLLHVHENRPGVLSAINSVFAENHINIGSQFLQTSDKIGYVVIDVDRDYSDVALEKLAEIEGTIRCRVLF